MTESDRDYYSARARTERERGELAADPVVAKVHRQLADMYEERLGESNSAPRPMLRVIA